MPAPAAPDPAPPADGSPGDLLYDRHGFPHPAMRNWCLLLAGITCAGTAFLLPLLIPADHCSLWGLIGLGIGAVFGAMIYGSVAQGTRLTIDAGGTLHYFLGRRENLRVDIRAITDWGPVASGMLRGIGADCPIEQIEILHRKGVRIPQLQDQQRGLGFALVFEFQEPGEAARLRAIQAAFADQPT